MNEYQQLSREATELICSLAENRKNIEWVVDTDEEREIPVRTIAWVLEERKALTEFINQKRAERNLSPISSKDVLKKVEKPAVGHVDYAQKIGFGAANLILQEK